MVGRRKLVYADKMVLYVGILEALAVEVEKAVGRSKAEVGRESAAESMDE